jgi:thiol-disulfide isomerase/thioredoxin
MAKTAQSVAAWKEAIQQNKLVVVAWTANWCNVCKKFAPVVEKLAQENPDVLFLFSDIEVLKVRKK